AAMPVPRGIADQGEDGLRITNGTTAVIRRHRREEVGGERDVKLDRAIIGPYRGGTRGLEAVRNSQRAPNGEYATRRSTSGVGDRPGKEEGPPVTLRRQIRRRAEREEERTHRRGPGTPMMLRWPHAAVSCIGAEVAAASGEHPEIGCKAASILALRGFVSFISLSAAASGRLRAEPLQPATGHRRPMATSLGCTTNSYSS